jgi:hypothetical protein
MTDNLGIFFFNIFPLKLLLIQSTLSKDFFLKNASKTKVLLITLLKRKSKSVDDKAGRHGTDYNIIRE